MDLIRGSAFFTILLHCVLANPLPQNGYLGQKPDTYDIVSPIPESGILQTPYYGEIPKTSVSPTYVIKPSWHNRPLDNPVRKNEDKNIHQQTYKPELPGTKLKGIGLKYPLTIPRVKLGFVGHNGMLPVKTIQKSSENKPDPLNPTRVSNKVVNHGIELNKKVTLPSIPINSDQGSKQVLPGNVNYPSTSLSLLYGQEIPLNALQYTPSPKLVLPGVLLNPTNFGYSTTPGIDYKKYEAVNNYQYTPDITGADGSIPGNSYPVTSGYSEDISSRKAVDHTGLYKTYVPEITGPKLDQTSAKKDGGLPVTRYADLLVGVLKPINVNIPTFGKENQIVELPPVPTTMSLLRRAQLALLNTVAGLPGGNPQALDSIRAG